MRNNTRRYKRMVIDPRRFCEAMLQGSLVSLSSELPADTKYVGFGMDFASHTNFFIIESKEFKEVRIGEMAPLFEGEILIKKIT